MDMGIIIRHWIKILVTIILSLHVIEMCGKIEFFMVVQGKTCVPVSFLLQLLERYLIHIINDKKV